MKGLLGLSGCLMLLQVLVLSCKHGESNHIEHDDEVGCCPLCDFEVPTMVIGTVGTTISDGLKIYYPEYNRIDLVCDTIPSKDNYAVTMIAEAAFTGDLLTEFKHSNIAGNHVSGGVYYEGYNCPRNTGAFVYYDGQPKFIYKDFDSELKKAAKRGGCGFTQEMMIHKGKIVPHRRPDSNTNEFRALCLINDGVTSDGKVAVIDSDGDMQFGDFINKLLENKVTEALYLDMGPGWNYSWYRNHDGEIVEIHPTPTEYATNWITFFFEHEEGE